MCVYSVGGVHVTVTRPIRVVVVPVRVVCVRFHCAVLVLHRTHNVCTGVTSSGTVCQYDTGKCRNCFSHVVYEFGVQEAVAVGAGTGAGPRPLRLGDPGLRPRVFVFTVSVAGSTFSSGIW